MRLTAFVLEKRKSFKEETKQELETFQRERKVEEILINIKQQREKIQGKVNTIS